MDNYRLLIKLVRPIVNFIWPLQIINRNKFQEGKGVYVCNHYSVFDANHFVTDLFDNRLNILMKKEAMTKGIGGKFLDYVGAIPITRGELDLKAMKRCLDVLRSNKPLLVFPEGTRNKTGSREMLEFKDGPVVFALKTKSSIYPFVYDKPLKFFRKSYLICGNRIDLSEYYDKPINDVREQTTILVRSEMEKLQQELYSLLANKKALKMAIKQDKIDRKNIKLAHKKAKQLSKKAKKDSKKAKVEA